MNDRISGRYVHLILAPAHGSTHLHQIIKWSFSLFIRTGIDDPYQLKLESDSSHVCFEINVKYKMSDDVSQKSSSFFPIMFVLFQSAAKQEMEFFPCADIVSYFLLLLLVSDWPLMR